MQRNASGSFPAVPLYAGFLSVSSPKYTALLTGLPVLGPGARSSTMPMDSPLLCMERVSRRCSSQMDRRACFESNER